MKRLLWFLWPVLLVLMLPALLRPGAPAPERLPQVTTGPESGVARMDGRTVIDLNRADEELLQSIPGVGPVLAARIAAYLREKGPLTSPEDLEAVEGVGPAKLRAIEEATVIR